MTKESVLIEEYVVFNLSDTHQLLQARTKLMIKTKLHTYPHKQILRKPIKKLLQND